MPSLESDEWISKNSPISAERLHAIGLITLRWNECEFYHFHLFREVLALPSPEAWALVFDMGDESLNVRIKTLIKIRQYPDESCAVIENVLAVYTICRQNRNSIAHAWSSAGHGPEKELKSRSKKPDTMETAAIPADLSTLRRVAEELDILQTRLWLLGCYLEDGILQRQPPLLEILLLPASLSTSQPSQTKPPRPPRPSSASRRAAAMDRQKKE